MSSNGFASADQLQAAAGRRRYGETILPVGGLRVRFQSWKEAELASYDTEVMSRTGRELRKDRVEDATRRFLVRSLVDGNGNRLYRDDQADLLKEWDTANTQHLYEQVRQFVGLDRDHIGDLVKNSEATLVVDTPSGSPID